MASDYYGELNIPFHSLLYSVGLGLCNRVGTASGTGDTGLVLQVLGSDLQCGNVQVRVLNGVRVLLTLQVVGEGVVALLTGLDFVQLVIDMGLGERVPMELLLLLLELVQAT